MARSGRGRGSAVGLPRWRGDEYVAYMSEIGGRLIVSSEERDDERSDREGEDGERARAHPCELESVEGLESHAVQRPARGDARR